MRDSTSFRRKIIYLALMALLLVPLSWISRPAFIRPDGQLSRGGVLMRMRQDHGLAQANLGEIDPASESMKLATLGMRGVAANLLWEKANDYKKKEDWDNLTATLNQIKLLQPNFISVWQFQSWNLSYNVSVEFDNYRHRYHWVKKGIDFLMEGTKYNRNEPRLLWDLGWFFGHKFGRSDEYRQFRRMYRADQDFHQELMSDSQLNLDETWGPDGKPDNWLTANQWFSEAQRVVDKEGVPIKGKNPLVFHSDPPKALIRFADAIEEEGYLDDKARIAWINAQKGWDAYGDRDIPSSYGYKIRLNDFEVWDQRAKQRTQELEELLPGVRQRLKDQRMAQLTDQERRLLDTPKHQWNNDYDIGMQAEEKINVTHDDVIAEAPDDVRKEARLLAGKIKEAEAFARTIRRYRDIVNFVYWRTRCEVERTDRAIEGRRYLYEADQAFANIDLEGAREKYEAAWERWAKIHEEHPALADDVTAEDLVDAVKEYRSLLGQMDEPEFPPPGFKMMKLLEQHADAFGMSKEQVAAAIARAEQAETAVEEDAEEKGGEEDAASPQDIPEDDGSSEDAPEQPAPEQEDSQETS